MNWNLNQLIQDTKFLPPLPLQNSNAANCAFNSLIQTLVNVPELFLAIQNLSDEFKILKFFLNNYKTIQKQHYSGASTVNSLNSLVIRSHFKNIFPAFQPSINEQLDAHELLGLIFSKIEAFNTETKVVHPLFTKVALQTYFKDNGEANIPINPEKFKKSLTDPNHKDAYTVVNSVSPSVIRNFYDWHIFIEIPDELTNNLSRSNDTVSEAGKYYSHYTNSIYPMNPQRYHFNNLHTDNNSIFSNYYNPNRNNYYVNNNNNSSTGFNFQNSEEFSNYFSHKPLQYETNSHSSSPSSTTFHSKYFTNQSKTIQETKQEKENKDDTPFSYFKTQLSKSFDIKLTEESKAIFLQGQDKKLHNYTSIREVKHLYEAPSFLCICINRLKYTEIERNNRKYIFRKKISVNFPVASRFTLKKIPNCDQAVYELQAFISHVGENFEHGHYINYIKKEDQQWYYCSDMHVDKKSEQETIKAAEQSYILFYKKSTS